MSLLMTALHWVLLVSEKKFFGEDCQGKMSFLSVCKIFLSIFLATVVKNLLKLLLITNGLIAC